MALENSLYVYAMLESEVIPMVSGVIFEMIRLAFIFIGAYTWGHQSLTEYRPNVLSGALMEFHAVVNTVANDIAKIRPELTRALQPEKLLAAYEKSNKE